MSIPYPAKPLFTQAQMAMIATIFANAGQVIFGITVVTPLINGFDKTNWSMVVLGTAVVLLCWAVSITIANRKELDDI
jgi:threonine/homoserine/homoserine lactone efflux protein